jgi:Spy/CpxP family protein refolding chaperone
MTALFGRMRLLGVALLAATFVAGALSGAAIERVLGAEEPGAVDHDSEQDPRRAYIIDQVDMSEQQRTEIDAILERRSERMRSVWQEVEPRMEAVTDSARMDIMGVLTPEQRAEYERKLEERRRKRSPADSSG